MTTAIMLLFTVIENTAKVISVILSYLFVEYILIIIQAVLWLFWRLRNNFLTSTGSNVINITLLFFSWKFFPFVEPIQFLNCIYMSVIHVLQWILIILMKIYWIILTFLSRAYDFHKCSEIFDHSINWCI